MKAKIIYIAVILVVIAVAYYFLTGDKKADKTTPTRTINTIVDPKDALREKWRRAGYTDEEIEDLIAGGQF